ncbi:hypothetical protein HO644_11260 [Streptococcus suis]|nr:hypothetical protein [Streptococcus suis]
MSQPIVPLTIPKSRRFEKKSRNDAYSISKSEQTHFLWTILFRVSLFNPRMISWSLSMTDSNV